MTSIDKNKIVSNNTERCLKWQIIKKTDPGMRFGD